MWLFFLVHCFPRKTSFCRESSIRISAKPRIFIKLRIQFLDKKTMAYTIDCLWDFGFVLQQYGAVCAEFLAGFSLLMICGNGCASCKKLSFCLYSTTTTFYFTTLLFTIQTLFRPIRCANKYKQKKEKSILKIPTSESESANLQSTVTIRTSYNCSSKLYIFNKYSSKPKIAPN